MKISIIGVGRVGTAIAFAIVQRKLAAELVLVGRNKLTTEGDAADLAHASSFVKHADVRPGDMADTAGSDVVIFSASAAGSPRINRLDEAKPNAELYKKIVPEAAKYSPNALFLIVSNPVDVMTYVALKLSGFSASRVFGTGTLLDTGRFRDLLSRQLGIDTHDIRAYILGEHGDSQFAATSVASAGGAKLDFSKPELRQCIELARNGGAEVARKKGYTNFAIASATAMILETIAGNARSILPVSTLLGGNRGYQDLGDVCLSVPAVVGRAGVLGLIEVDLSESEKEQMRTSARIVSDVSRQVLGQ